MRKYQLMGGVAAAAMALLPLTAYAQSAADLEDEIGDSLESRPEGLQYGLRGVADITYENEIETEIETDIDFTKDVVIAGTVTLSGEVVTDAAAVAVVDNKQALVGNTLIYTEENELNAENGWVDPVFGPGVSESGQDPNDGLIDGVQQDRIRVGFFAPVINTVNGFNVDVAGNVGLNFTAGNYNVQENIAALASSNFEGDDEDTGGLAEASLTALQLGVGNSIGSNETEILDEDDPESGGGGNNFRVRNTVFAGTIDVDADGNLGINAAAGAMNMQKNALVMAVATDSAMAEATAAVIQASVGNYLEVQDEINVVNPGTYTGSGNLGVNLAAGSYNQQMNSLVAAVGLAGAGNGGGTPTPPPPPPPPPPPDGS